MSSPDPDREIDGIILTRDSKSWRVFLTLGDGSESPLLLFSNDRGRRSTSTESRKDQREAASRRVPAKKKEAQQDSGADSLKQIANGINSVADAHHTSAKLKVAAMRDVEVCKSLQRQLESVDAQLLSCRTMVMSAMNGNHQSVLETALAEREKLEKV